MMIRIMIMMKRMITTKMVERKGMFSQRTIFLIRNLVERRENAALTTWTNNYIYNM